MCRVATIEELITPSFPYDLTTKTTPTTTTTTTTTTATTTTTTANTHYTARNWGRGGQDADPAPRAPKLLVILTMLGKNTKPQKHGIIACSMFEQSFVHSQFVDNLSQACIGA